MNQLVKNEKKVKKEASGCWIWLGGTGGATETVNSKKYPYVWIWEHRQKQECAGMGGGGFSCRINILQLYLKSAQVPVLNVSCASHLCHTPKCINPDHIILETIADNADRKKCHKARGRKCIGNHQPKCY